MNHDISHCAGSSTSTICPTRDICLRYKAHLDLVAIDYKYPVSYISAGCCMSEDCIVYGTPEEKKAYSEYLEIK